jgi:hypothetical protein
VGQGELHIRRVGRHAGLFRLLGQKEMEANVGGGGSGDPVFVGHVNLERLLQFLSEGISDHQEGRWKERKYTEPGS